MKEGLFLLENNQWSEMSTPLTGNPTKSTDVNDLIAWVKKKETRKQGKASKKRSLLQVKEVDYLFTTVENENIGLRTYFTLAYFWYQVSMIA